MFRVSIIVFIYALILRGNTRPLPIQTKEINDTKVMDTTENTDYGLTIDPCTHRNSSMLEISLSRKKQGQYISLTLCLMIEYLSSNRTKCYSLSSYHKSRRKVICWFDVKWLKSQAVIKALVYRYDDIGPAMYGELIFPGFCYDRCEAASPRLDKTVSTCGGAILMNLSSGTSVLKVHMKCTKCDSRKLHSLKTVMQAKDKVAFNIATDIKESSYELEILINLEAIPQDFHCKYRREIYIICESPEMYSSTEPAIVPPTQQNVLVTIVVIVGIVVLVGVILLISCRIRKRQLRRQAARQLGRQMMPLNNQL